MHWLAQLKVCDLFVFVVPNCVDFTVQTLMQIAFDALDHNGDGHITADELTASFITMGITREQAASRVRPPHRCAIMLPAVAAYFDALHQAQRWLAARDDNKSKSVTLDEFVDAYSVGVDPSQLPAYVRHRMTSSAPQAPSATSRIRPHDGVSHATSRVSYQDRVKCVL